MLNRTTLNRTTPHGRHLGTPLACAAVSALFALVAALPASAAPQSGVQANVTVPATVEAVSQGELELALGGISLSELNGEELAKTLAKLPGLGSLPLGQLTEALEKTVQTLAGGGGTLGQLVNPTSILSTLETQLKSVLNVGELLTILKGESLTTLLSGALTSSDVGQVVGGLLSGSEDPQQELEHLLSLLSAEMLQSLLGTSLSGAPFSVTTIEGSANAAGASVEDLAKALGTTVEQLPPTGLALVASLPDGRTLDALNGLGGLSMALLNPSKSVESGEEGKEGKEGAGGNTGSGGSETPGTTTTHTESLVTTLTSTNTVTGKSGATSAKSARLKWISSKVRKGVVTTVMQVPSIGTLVVSGPGLRTMRVHVTRAGRVTVRSRELRSFAASLAKHPKRHTKVRVKMSFTPATGAKASKSTVTHAVVVK
ncbi:MAG TPA: hypothetical protein VHZ73_11585 [Vicinamibacterales bacterium]|nr:hypothetical protein [Vicinamibacterales bacterium]